MTVAQLKLSASSENSPPAGLSDEARALWFVHADRWEDAHTIAQDIDTPVGSWIHALLHLIEGDETMPAIGSPEQRVHPSVRRKSKLSGPKLPNVCLMIKLLIDKDLYILFTV